MTKEKTKIIFTENKAEAVERNVKYESVYYMAHTGFVMNSFNRYPEWLKAWISQNHFKLDNGRLALLHKNANSISHEFTIGDCVIYFNEGKEIMCGAKALVKLIEMQTV